MALDFEVDNWRARDTARALMELIIFLYEKGILSEEDAIELGARIPGLSVTHSR